MKVKKVSDNRKALNDAIETNEEMTTISASVMGNAGDHKEVEDCVSIEVETKSIEGLTPLKVAKLITKLEKFDDMLKAFDSIDYNEVCISVLSEDEDEYEYVNICNVELVGFEPARSKVEQFDTAVAYLSICNNADHEKLDKAMNLSDDAKTKAVELFTDSRFDTLEGFINEDYLPTTISFKYIYKDTPVSYTKSFDSVEQANEYQEVFDRRIELIKQYKQNPTDENREIIRNARCELWHIIVEDIVEAYHIAH